jgi:hypothetical protein
VQLSKADKTQLSKLSLIEEMHGHALDGFSRPIIFSMQPGLDRWAIDYLHRAFVAVSNHLTMRDCRELAKMATENTSTRSDVVDPYSVELEDISDFSTE